MEAVLLQPTSGDHHQPTIKPQHVRSFKKMNNRALISSPFGNFFPLHLQGGCGGPFLNAPPNSISYLFYPPISSSINPVFHPQQPPLLPLPASKQHCINSLPSRNRGLSCPPVSRKVNHKNREKSLTPKKSKSSATTVRKEDRPSKSSDRCIVVASTKRLGPEPSDLPKDVSRVLSSLSGNTNSGSSRTLTASGDSISNFTISPPPPSSLPLPTFSLRPKLSCNSEAAGNVDAGATDNLRRLLRL